MQRHIKLTPGSWRAKTPVAIFRMQGSREVSFTEYESGHIFEIPEPVNGFWHALAASDFDEFTPEVEPVPLEE